MYSPSITFDILDLKYFGVFFPQKNKWSGKQRSLNKFTLPSKGKDLTCKMDSVVIPALHTKKFRCGVSSYWYSIINFPLIHLLVSLSQFLDSFQCLCPHRLGTVCGQKMTIKYLTVCVYVHIIAVSLVDA